ncbi:MAG TPA: glycosyltransferase family 9 protein [Pseudonocardiaceae bacterium]|nr:glycosyltransferase family 9 protein [Pseudonocardiaceae bacterium]
MPVLFVLRALRLGDLLVTVPALRALRRRWPGHRLVLAAPGGLTPIVREFACVDEVCPVAGLDDRPGPAWRWPDIAVNLHGRGPASDRLLAGLAPGRQLGHGAYGPPWREPMHERDRWCRMLAAHDIPADPADLRLRTPGPASPAPGAVVINAGASHASRHWPVDRFAAVARALAERHSVVFSGTATERGRATDVADRAGLPRATVLAGRTGLVELAALVAGARLVITADSGVAHLSYAYGTPSVVLFGPAPADRWGPPAEGPHTVLSADRHRRGDPFADSPDPALLGVGVADVVAAAQATSG